jgi:CRISPR-associated endonuclease/helicase Cas3
MVFSLMNYKSHPDKALEVHILGVLHKTKRNCNFPIAEIAVLFHDLGKINSNFQEKLKPENKGVYLGYTNHSYLSAYIFASFLEKNQQELKAFFGDSFSVKVKCVITIIAKHHGNLPNLEKMLGLEQISLVEEFLKTKPLLPISDFYSNKLNRQHNGFEVLEHDFLRKKLGIFNHKDQENWKLDALNFFMDMQFAFAALIEADKRDAGHKAVRDYYHFDHAIDQNITEMEQGLNTIFSGLALKQNKSELDILRTQLREEAVVNINIALKENKRIFSLTAPTGAGKTFTLLALAREIQRVNERKIGILYALPFLSITEQVESIIKKSVDVNLNQSGFISDLLSFSSKSINTKIENIQKNLDSDASNDKLNDLLQEDFIAHTFDHPFIITTFVQFFETLVSNHNSTLLKLPNFSNRIFLIDEIQALPPSLYIFFAAWLKVFCEKNNSYAIVSTATMPHFSFPIKPYLKSEEKPELLFKGFEKKENQPFELLDAKKYFDADIFNRYRIDLIKEDNFDVSALKKHIENQNQSVLVVLNTIDDTKKLYASFNDKKDVILLNTHFIPLDRRAKIAMAKEKLSKNEKIILISTQLIEAGVDIDFPIVYRDLCPLPSLIQSAGRCNRNKKLNMGQVFFFNLCDENGKSRAELIYKNEAKDFLNFCKTHIQHGVTENQLYEVQALFFKSIASNLTIGGYKILGEDVNMIQLVNDAKFETLGGFQLINEQQFGSQYQYYIRENENDDAYDYLVELMFKMVKAEGYENSKQYKIRVNTQMKKMADRLLTIRLMPKKEDLAPHFLNVGKEYMNIRVLSNLNDYSFETGILLDSIHNSFL